MSKKTTESKAEKKAARKQPAELKEEQLDTAQGGIAAVSALGSTTSDAFKYGDADRS